MSHYYLAPYVGEGTFLDPFRPRGSEQPGWSAIDLRPNSTVITGSGIPANTTVTAINTTTDDITISAAATATASGVTFTTKHPVVFSYAWDTTDVANGSHTLQGLAYDNALNEGAATAITVTVAN